MFATASKQSITVFLTAKDDLAKLVVEDQLGSMGRAKVIVGVRRKQEVPVVVKERSGNAAITLNHEAYVSVLAAAYDQRFEVGGRYVCFYKTAPELR